MIAEARLSGPVVDTIQDLNTGHTLYSYRAGVGRLPASNEKIYTTATALLRFGPSATLQTTIYGVGSLSSARGQICENDSGSSGSGHFTTRSFAIVASSSANARVIVRT